MFKVIIGVVVATIIGLVAFSFIPQAMGPNNNNDDTALKDDPNKITIGITGEVVKPGNYIMEEGSTMQDLIDKAGGVNTNADEKAYYFDAEIKANNEYYIAPKYDLADVCSENPIIKVNLNDADKEELMTVNGLGDAISTQIIQYRSDNGVFYRLEDIMNVNGVGNATFNKVKNFLYLHD